MECNLYIIGNIMDRVFKIVTKYQSGHQADKKFYESEKTFKRNYDKFVSRYLRAGGKVTGYEFKIDRWVILHEWQSDNYNDTRETKKKIKQLGL